MIVVSNPRLVRKAAHSKAISAGVKLQQVTKPPHSKAISAGVKLQLVTKPAHSKAISAGVKLQLVTKNANPILFYDTLTPVLHTACSQSEINSCQ